MFALFLWAFLPYLANAQEYYADLQISVHRDGTVRISGITNDNEFFPGNYGEFTSKKGNYWVLNISSEKTFSDYVLDVRLPERAEFNYLKSSGRSRVSYSNGIRIISSGSGEMNLVIQYRIESRDNRFYFYTLLFIMLFFVLSFIFVKKYKKYKKGKDKKMERDQTHNQIHIDKKNSSAFSSSIDKGEDYDYSDIRIVKKTLAESQEKIVDILLDAGGSLVQRQLQHRSGLPKATLSRNIDVLKNKGIILKQSRGMTNMIMLNKEFSKK